MKSIFALGVVALVGLGFLVGSQWAGRRPSGPLTDRSNEAVVDEPGGRALGAARLNGQVAALEAQVADLKRAASGTGGGGGEPPAAPALSSAEERARDAQGRRAYLDGVEAAFQKEPLDSQWSAAATSAVQVVVGAEGVRLDVRGLDCRSVTCRAEIADDGSGDAQQEKLAQLAMRLAGKLPNVLVDHLEDSSGRKKIVLYLSRPTASAGK
jgi:hypothetical protein